MPLPCSIKKMDSEFVLVAFSKLCFSLIYHKLNYLQMFQALSSMVYHSLKNVICRVCVTISPVWKLLGFYSRIYLAWQVHLKSKWHVHLDMAVVVSSRHMP
jgi:hypothetical protein